MRALQLKVNATIRATLYQSLEQFVPENLKLDAARDVFSATQSAVNRTIASFNIDGPLKKVATRVSDHSAREFKRIGIKLDDEPKLAAMISKWRKELVSTVKSVEETELGRLEKILRENKGLRVEALREKLDDRLNISSLKRAQSLARNQVVQLSSAVNQERAAAAGIEEAEWMTAGNEKVSDAHAELEGVRFRLDEPVEDSDGNVGFPGTIRPNCQCQMMPVLPGM